MKTYALGIDIGGTKTALCIADNNYKIICFESFPTNPEEGAENLVTRIKEAYLNLCKENDILIEQVTLAGVACPGPLDVKAGRTIHIATMGFKDVPIKSMLKNALKLPVYLENDANLAALAESVFGVAKGNDPLVYITISTGIGCGIIIDGEILTDDKFDTELGHYNVEDGGRKCACGKSGCLELYSSGTAIAKDTTDVLGKKTDTKTAFTLARNGSEQVQKIISDATKKLAFVVNTLCKDINPKSIVLGGSVTKDSDLFFEELKSLVSYNCSIVISDLKGEQGVLGALCFGYKNHFKEK